MKKTLEKIVKKIKNINNKYEDIITNSKLRFIFQFFPKNIFLMLFFIILLFIFIPQITNNKVITYNSCSDFDIKAHRFEKGESISYNLSPKKANKAEYINITFFTFTDYNNKLNIKIYENDNILLSKNFNIKSRIAKVEKEFNIKKIKFNENNKYVVEITPLKVDNIEVRKDKNTNEMKITLLKKSPFYNFVLITSIIFILVFLFINYLINNNKIRLENKFLLLMLVYIVPLLFIIPSYQIPDEPYHFYQAYGVSTYHFNRKIGDHINDKRYVRPSNFECLDYSNIQTLDNVTKKSLIGKCFIDTHKKKYKGIGSNTNNLLYYIPAGIMLRITSIFTSSPMIIFFMGRLICLLIAFFILYKAVKITPKYKPLFLVIGCIPVAVQQMISYSYDGLLNSCALLSVAYFIKFYTDKGKINRKELIIYILIACILLYLKRVYFVLVGLLLLIPSKKFKKGLKEKLIVMGTAIIIPVIIFLLCNVLFSATNPKLAKYPTNVNPTEQINYLVDHPTKLPRVIYDTLNISFYNYIREMIGVLGWLRYIMPNMIIFSFYLMFALLVLSSKCIFKKIKERLYLVFLILLSLGMIFMAMYTQWSEVGAYIAVGIQGRYAIPLILPILMCLMPKKNKINIKNNTIYTYLNVIFIVLIVFVLTSYY